MKQVQILGTIRREGEKATNKKLRREGKVPTILYGKGEKNLVLHIPITLLLPILEDSEPTVIELTVDKKKYLSIINDVQYHPVSDFPIHLDLLTIKPKIEIKMDVPVAFKGQKKSPGINKGGELAIKQRSLKVRALQSQMPNELLFDVSELDLGDKLNIGSLTTTNFTILAPSNAPVATIIIPRALRSKSSELVEKDVKVT